MLRLLSLLQSRRDWSGAELAERLDVTERTVRRDVDRLRELGYPVTGTRGAVGGYRMGAGTALPPLLLDDDEAVAAAVALRTAASSRVSGIGEIALRALAKLEQVLPKRLRQQVAALADATTAVTGVRTDAPDTDPELLTVVAAACRDHESVTFEHRARDGAATSRRVEPQGLVTVRGLWYLVAFDLAREDWRTFRLDRVHGLATTRRRFTPRPPPAPDLAEYVARSLASAPYRYALTATVQASAESVSGRLLAPLPGRIERLGDDLCRVHLGSDRIDTVVQDLVALDAPYTVDCSEAVAEQLRATANRLTEGLR
ncbi:WYL domain-containing protein [Allosaccharopolyspora coralli]|uniref:WYL domain-containing protein n=2 Tax=Allosaccharopolyspora coralli TaxID=2665642 RepID=A0A5Q3QDC8_9PSEU|nr:WYL domain-containing protein [Allosaccharopolyspora coralli]